MRLVLIATFLEGAQLIKYPTPVAERQTRNRSLPGRESGGLQKSFLKDSIAVDIGGAVSYILGMTLLISTYRTRTLPNFLSQPEV